MDAEKRKGMSRGCSLPTYHCPLQHLSPFLAGDWAAEGHLVLLNRCFHEGQMTPYMENAFCALQRCHQTSRMHAAGAVPAPQGQSRVLQVLQLSSMELQQWKREW